MELSLTKHVVRYLSRVLFIDGIFNSLVQGHQRFFICGFQLQSEVFHIGLLILESKSLLLETSAQVSVIIVHCLELHCALEDQQFVSFLVACWICRRFGKVQVLYSIRKNLCTVHLSILTLGLLTPGTAAVWIILQTPKTDSVWLCPWLRYFSFRCNQIDYVSE